MVFARTRRAAERCSTGEVGVVSVELCINMKYRETQYDRWSDRCCRTDKNMEFQAAFLPLLIIIQAATLTSQQESPSTSSPTISDIVISQPLRFASAGRNYSLVCFITVTESTDPPTITWMSDDGMPIDSDAMRTVAGSRNGHGSYSSTLIFTPFRASDTGTSGGSRGREHRAHSPPPPPSLSHTVTVT
jgi:hypothetical protein